MQNLVKRRGIWTARITINGRGRWRSLGTRDRTQAERMLRPALDRLRGLPGAVDALKKGCAATVADACSAYRVAAAARRLATGRPKASTTESYLWSLYHVCKLAHGAEDGKLPVATLSAQTVTRCIAALVGSAGPEIETQKRARSSACHLIRNARAVFSRWAMPGMRELNLPDLSDFLRAEARAARVKYKLPPPEIRAAIDNASQTLAVDDPYLFAAFILCRAGGLRAGEAAQAQWSWLLDGLAIGATLNVPCEITKNGRARSVPLHPDVVRALRAQQRDGDPYILAGGFPSTRYKLIERKLAAWLRGCGLNKDRWPKAAHELRKLAGADWYTDHGAEVCAAWLGDTLQVAWQYYSDLTRQPAPKALLCVAKQINHFYHFDQ